MATSSAGDTGRGWAGCQAACASEASFSSQAGPLKWNLFERLHGVDERSFGIRAGRLNELQAVAIGKARNISGPTGVCSGSGTVYDGPMAPIDLSRIEDAA